MSDYNKLVKALRSRSTLCESLDCYACEAIHFVCIDKIMHDAAAAIEALQAEVGQWKAAVKGQEDGIKVLQTEVKRLEEAENSVENYKRMWLEKHEPKTARWEGWTSTHWSKRCDSNGDPIYTEHTYYQCSYCGRKTVVRENFCPNCGAVMEDMCEVQK